LHVLRQALAVVDAEMDGLAAAEPTSGLASRIRRAVAEVEADRPALDRGPGLGWRFGWVWPAMAAAATILVALAVFLGRGTTSAPEPRVAVGLARPQPIARTPVAEPSSEPVIPRDYGLKASEGGHRASFPSEPEVLVPQGESETLLRFVAIVHRQRLVPTLLAAAGQPSTDLAELAPIDIPPLEIVPLDSAATSGT
jgi:hypothetical protein